MLLTSGQSGSNTTSHRARRAGRLCSVAFVATIAVLANASAASAHEPPPTHNHFLTTPGSGDVVQIGPRVCANPDVLHDAFHNFHANVHTGAPRFTGGLAISAILC